MMASKFACWLHKEYIAKDGEADMSKYVELPFVPFVGLEIVFNEKEYDRFIAQKVEYSIENDCFWLHETDCVAEAGCPCGPEDNCCCIASELEYAKEHDWEVDKVRRGCERIHEPESWMFDPDKWFMTAPR